MFTIVQLLQRENIDKILQRDLEDLEDKARNLEKAAEGFYKTVSEDLKPLHF